MFSSWAAAQRMADDSDAVVDLDASADEQYGDDSAVDFEAQEDAQDGEGDESLVPEENHDESFEDPNEVEPNDGAASLPGPDDGAEEQPASRRHGGRCGSIWRGEFDEGVLNVGLHSPVRDEE